MSRIIISFLFVLCFQATVFTQDFDIATIGFYNLENLFDTLDTEGVKDTEFTPNGFKNWTSEKYQEKVDHMAFVISKLGMDKN